MGNLWSGGRYSWPRIGTAGLWSWERGRGVRDRSAGSRKCRGGVCVDAGSSSDSLTWASSHRAIRSARTTAACSGAKRGVIILTALDQISDRIDGLNAGADDYLVKPFDLAELSARIGSVARRLNVSIAKAPAHNSPKVLQTGALSPPPAEARWERGSGRA